MWPFDYFKKKREAKRQAALARFNQMKPSRLAPPMPRVAPSRQDRIDITTINDNAPVFAPVIFGVDPGHPSGDRTVYWEPLAGAGGTFDGGGASGDWSDSRRCSAPDTSSSSDSSYSDSSSSCDSGSSGSFD